MSGLGAFTSGFVDAAPTGIALSNNYQRGREARAKRQAGKIYADAKAGANQAIPAAEPAPHVETPPVSAVPDQPTTGPKSSAAGGSSPSPAAGAGVPIPAKVTAPTPASVMDYRQVADDVSSSLAESIGIEAAIEARNAILGESRDNFASHMMEFTTLYEQGDMKGAAKALEWANAYLPNGHGAMVTGNKAGVTVQGVDKEGNLFGTPMKMTPEMAVDMVHRARDPAAYNALTFNRDKLKHQMEVAEKQAAINEEYLELKLAAFENQKYEFAANKEYQYASMYMDYLHKSQKLDADNASTVGPATTSLLKDRQAFLSNENITENKDGTPTNATIARDLYYKHDLGGAVENATRQLAAMSGRIPGQHMLHLAEDAVTQAHAELGNDFSELLRKEEMLLSIRPDKNNILQIGVLNTAGQELFRYNTRLDGRKVVGAGGPGNGTLSQVINNRQNAVLGPDHQRVKYTSIRDLPPGSGGGTGGTGTTSGASGGGGIPTSGPVVEVNDQLPANNQGGPDGQDMSMEPTQTPSQPAPQPASQGQPAPAAIPQNPKDPGYNARQQSSVGRLLASKFGAGWLQQDAATLRQTVAGTDPTLMPFLEQILRDAGIVGTAAPTPPTGALPPV